VSGSTVPGCSRRGRVARCTRVEVASALWRKHRLDEIASSDAATLMAAFEADLEDGLYVVVGLVPEVADAATIAVERHGLRADDAVQLGAALVAREALGELDSFAAFDLDLRAAATAEGFAVVPLAFTDLGEPGG
jgi:uncharacterized protein